MKRMPVLVGALMLAALLTVPALAQEDGGTATRPDRRGQAGARRQNADQRGIGVRSGRAGRAADRTLTVGMGGLGMRGGVVRSYLESTEEAKELWIQLGQLQLRQHEVQWGLFELLNQEPVSREEVTAHMQAIRDIDAEIREVNEKLQPYRKQLDEPLGQRPGFGAREGQRPGRTWGAGGRTDEAQPRRPRPRQDQTETQQQNENGQQ